MSWALFNRKQTKPDLELLHCCSKCQSFDSILRLYFCTDCATLLCMNCTTCSVDTNFCPSCLVSVFSSSAFTSNHRCEQCTRCPACAQCLHSVFHASTQTYTMTCLGCKWASGSNLAATEVTGLLAAVKNTETDAQAKAEMQSLITMYKQRQRAAKSSSIGDKRSTSITSAQLFADVNQSINQSNSQTSASPLNHFLELDAAVNEIRAAGYTDPTHKQSSDSLSTQSFPPLPMWMVEGFSASGDGPHHANHLVSLTQRLEHPVQHQEQYAGNLPPRRQPLMTKLAHRCPTCIKFVVKPEANASKVGFEIHHSALGFVPRLTVADYPALLVGKANRITLFVQNPVVKHYRLRVSCVESVNSPETESINQSVTNDSCTVSIPSDWVWLPAFDDLPPLETSLSGGDSLKQPDDQPQIPDNPLLLHSRQQSKIGLFVTVIPRTTELTQFTLRMRLENLVPSKNATDAFTFHTRIVLGKALVEKSS